MTTADPSSRRSGNSRPCSSLFPFFAPHLFVAPYRTALTTALRRRRRFLHPHWWLDKLDMTGSSIQLINGIFLVLSFFGARIVYGAMQTVVLWKVLDDPRIGDTFRWGFRLANIALNRSSLFRSFILLWLTGRVLMCGWTVLNWSWFRLMLLSLKKRFIDPPRTTKDSAAKSE